MGAEGHIHIRQLTQKARQGDREAFEDLYLKYRLAIRGYISSRIFDADTIKDIEQATWALVLEKIDSYDPDRMAFYSFVKYKTMYLIREHYRRPEIPISELKKLFPDCETDTDILDLIANVDPMRLWTSTEDRLIAAMLIARTILSMDRPPHQVLAFGFNTLLEYGPSRVVSELLEIPLGSLCDRLMLEYGEVTPLAHISPFFEPLKRKIRRKVKDILHDAASKRIYRQFLDKIVGETTLKDYCGSVPRNDYQERTKAKVSDWTHKVLMSARRIILRMHACGETENRTS